MKNSPRFVLELLITIVVALLLSGLVAFVLYVFSLSTGGSLEGQMLEYSISSTVFGLIVGYKLNSLIRTHKK